MRGLFFHGRITLVKISFVRKSLSLLLALGAATLGGEVVASSRASAQEVDTRSVGTSARAFVATEGNGTAGQAGLGIFIPFSRKDNSLFYFDAQVTGDWPSGPDAYESQTGSWGSNIGLESGDIPFLDENSVLEQVDFIFDEINEGPLEGAPFSLDKIDFEVDEGYSFSPRLGAKFLSKSKKWLFDINAGYDLRYVNASTDWGTLGTVGEVLCGFINVFGDEVGCAIDKDSNGAKLYEQASFELSATNGKFTFSGYGNIALTDADSLTDLQATLFDEDGAFLAAKFGLGLAPASTYGLDVDYAVNSKFGLSLGGYYINADRKFGAGSAGLPSIEIYDQSVDSMGVKLGLGYSPTPAVNIAVNASHDEIYETRVSASVGYKFGASNSWRAPLSPAESIQQALSKVPSNRNIRLVNASSIELGVDGLDDLLDIISGDEMLVDDVPSIGRPRMEIVQIDTTK